MIPVAFADEPKWFDAHVRKRGAVAIQRLLGKNVKAPGRKPSVTYARPEAIPADKFPAYWTEVHKSDGKSALDGMMDAYGQFCAYLAMRIERATGSPAVDHYVPKARDWKLVYEWSNYRLSAGCVNGAKGTRAYKNVFLLADDNSMRKIDLGLIHSSAATSLVELILSRLKQEDIVVEGVSPNFLTRYWPPALPEWSTKSVRDAFYASPKFPRLLKPDAVKDTISRGLDAGTVAYVGKANDGGYEPFVYKRSLGSKDIEIAEGVYLIVRERAEEYLAKKAAPQTPTGATQPALGGTAPTGAPQGRAPGATPTVPTGASESPPGTEIAGFHWSGEISTQKWMNFYTKVLSRFATSGGLKLTVSVEVEPPGGTTMSKVEETRVALRELGLSEDVAIKRRR